MADSKLDTTKIQKAVQAGIPLSITTHTLPHEMELYMAEVLVAFLKELNQEAMSEYLIYCLNELTTNAKKANTKRVYFKEKGLDINNIDDYDNGMKSFKSDTLDNIKHYLKMQQEQGFYIKLIFQHKADKIKIEIRNNAPLTIFEYKRVHDKIARAQRYSSVDDAFSQILDDSEGAGLGIIIMILMLKKLGLSGDNFQVFSENDETVSRIILPLSGDVQEKMSILSTELVNMIDKLPQFPENIIHINNMLNDPEFKLSDIARSISSDIALTADLLKLVNSAAFSLSSPCRNIPDAVKLVGTRGIKNLLYSVGSMKSVGTATEEQKSLWQHCHRVAFYSYNLSRNFFSKQRDVIEDSYVCGLLHDMGKGVFYSAQPHFMTKLKNLSDEKTIEPHTFEKLLSGQNHAEIGALIAAKWNFPPVIIETIHLHHDPDVQKPLSVIVYFANMLANYQQGGVEFYQFDTEILEVFKIANEDQLVQLSEKLKEAFVSESVDD